MLHIPVMLREVMHFAAPIDNGVVVDCTFGAGGYAGAFLAAGAKQVIALDRDPNVASIAAKLSEENDGKLVFHNTPNANLQEVLGQTQVDVVVYDLGVSSMQLDNAQRGFSFLHDGLLDMRMDGDNGEMSAQYVVNNYSEMELAKVIFEYGDERKSRHIARKICQYRAGKIVTTTRELADIVISAVGPHKGDIHPATRTFQALRMEVNAELQQLKQSLLAAHTVVKPGGRIVVVSFHSGEDSIVKSLFHSWCGKVKSQEYVSPLLRHLTHENIPDKTFMPLHKKVVLPSVEEVAVNPRARSAKLRAVQKL